MPVTPDEDYQEAERRIEQARFSGDSELYLKGLGLTALPESLSQLQQLQLLFVSGNELTALPESLSQLQQLQNLDVSDNQLTALPESLSQLQQLQELDVSGNQLIDLPASLGNLERLKELDLDKNPLNPELTAAYAEGLEAVKRYLRAKSLDQVPLNEAKLILIGEGEVGKSCLLGALRGDPWEEGRPTTHGIEIKQVQVIDPDTGTEITLNGWDFGGQPVYRSTHQLFFSAPAVYLVVWKPREGPQQNLVEYWIKLVKYRAPKAKIIVVATHGGPGQRQPDINRQELWDQFGRDTLIDFIHVDSKPDEHGDRLKIAELKEAIAKVAADLPEMGRKVPKRWQDARVALQKTGAPHLSLDRVLELCREQKMDNDEARDFVAISHRLGHLIHYADDPALRNIVVLKPDWLTKAISYVLDDRQTRKDQGLVSFERLGQLWDDPNRDPESRYSPELHPVFLSLMERFDISYRVADPSSGYGSDGTSLVAQLAPDTRPERLTGWDDCEADGDEQQVQVCRIIDAEYGRPAYAEGLFYRLIVRLHKYSLGRKDYKDSVHWQRGLVLDDDYNGRALLEHTANDVRITVRAPYPERFLSVLTNEVKWLVDNIWKGLHCEVMVPCVEPCGKKRPGTGLFKVQFLIANKKQKEDTYRCPECNELQSIDHLLRNAPYNRKAPLDELIAQGFEATLLRLDGLREQLSRHETSAEGRYGVLNLNDRRMMSQIEDGFTGLMQTLTDDAKEGPRLFSFQPIEPGFFDRPKWISLKLRLTLWCEHSRLPLPALNGKGDRRGVYDLKLRREWVVKAAPFLKALTTTLSLVLPVAGAATKLVLDEAVYKGFEKELDIGQKTIDAALKGADKAGEWLGHKDAPGLEQGEAMRAHGSVLRELQVILKQRDPGFGGLVRVQNRRHEFLWVHPQFEEEY